MPTLPVRLTALLCLAVTLLAGCAGHPALPLALVPHARVPSAAEHYDQLADRFLSGEEIPIRRLQQVWLLTPDLLARSDALARTDTATGWRLEAFAGDLEALAGDSRAVVRTAFATALDQIFASGDGSPTAPWKVTSRSDAEAVLKARGLEVVGGYYQASVEQPLTLRLMARSHADAASREWVFDLSTVFEGIRAARSQHRPGSGYTPHHHIRHLARLGDGAAVTSAAMLILASDANGAREAAVERLFTAAAAGNQIADALLADQYWHLAQERQADVRERALTEAARGYRRAAATGFTYAHYRLGDLLIEEGRAAEGIEHLEIAAARDHIESLRLLASLYRDGRGVAKDRERTLALYRRLHGLSDTAGRYSYAYWALMPADAEADPQAMAGLLANVDAGHASSISLLGDLHALGRQRPQDHDVARDLWRRAALAALDEGDVETVQAVARSLVHNPESLRDPEFAARVLALAGQPRSSPPRSRQVLSQDVAASSGQGTPVPPRPQ